LGASLPATRYNVYLVPGGQVRTGASEKAAAEVPSVPRPALLLPVPVNEKPVEGKTFEDPGLEFGVERCYVVRSVDTYGGAQIESEAVAPACVTPADIFPPAPPRNLAVVSSGGTVSLIWEPNSEPDLAGYLVLRATAGSETLQPLTPAPVTGTTYRDTAVQPGVRYVYAVAAVDRATPPNLSGLSNRVEEVVR